MNKPVVRFWCCMACIVIPILAAWYGIWESHQPKTGPVGDGKTHITFIQCLPFITTFMLGCLNLPRAIVGYKRDRLQKRE